MKGWAVKRGSVKRRALLAGAGAALVGLRPAYTADCAPRLLASTALRNTDGFLSIVAAVDDRRCSFLLDTGADAGLLAPRVATQLALPHPTWARARVSGTGGRARDAAVVTMPTLAIGDTLLLRQVPVPVGVLPSWPAIEPPVVGLIGGDVLRQFAVEIDVAGGTLRLFEPAPDAGGPARCNPPWTGRFATLPFRWLGNRVVVAAALDGRPVTALLDTGARSRIVSLAAAHVPPDVLGGEPGGFTSGVEGRESVYHWHRFGSLTVGGERVAGPVLTVAPLAEDVDLLLGADWFATHVVWFSYSTGFVFVRPAA